MAGRVLSPIPMEENVPIERGATGEMWLSVPIKMAVETHYAWNVVNLGMEFFLASDSGILLVIVSLYLQSQFLVKKCLQSPLATVRKFLLR